jgi:hypothetical protein
MNIYKGLTKLYDFVDGKGGVSPVGKFHLGSGGGVFFRAGGGVFSRCGRGVTGFGVGSGVGCGVGVGVFCTFVGTSRNATEI